MSWFREEDRVIIRLLADLLIPEAEGMPAASSIGVGDALLDQVVQWRADLAPAVLAATRAARNSPDPRAALEGLRQNDPDTWQDFCLAIAGAYYTSPVVRGLLGYTGPERRPLDPDAAPDHTDLLAPVIARGPIWRAPPSSSSGAASAADTQHNTRN